MSGGALKREAWGGDVVFKYAGFFAQGEVFWRKVTPLAAGVAKFNSDGYNLEAGYLFGGPSKGKWSLAGRYSSWDPTDAVSGNDRSELRLGVNWFYNKHFAKIQADWGQLEDKKAGTKDQEIRVQTQLYF
ncbi:MAG: porin [Vicinamibacteria bacterium]